MAPTILQASAAAWALVARQHGVIARRQLLALGFSAEAIRHRLATGRLHPLHRGVYAAGRPDVDERGRWMAAVLAAGDGAALSHRSAAALWGLVSAAPGPLHVVVPAEAARRRPGLVVHRRAGLAPVERFGIPVTPPADTLVDLATALPRSGLEAAVNQADVLGLLDPEALRVAVDALGPRPGTRPLRALLDRRTFVLTDSELERRFLPLARAAGLPKPRTQMRTNGWDVDFCWPELGLVVETDGLRYHRTPAEQARDRRRDQDHTAAGLTPLRFTHAQVRFEPAHVQATLAAVAQRLKDRGGRDPVKPSLSGRRRSLGRRS
jgi:very-short-patch-repair endonuclease